MKLNSKNKKTSIFDIPYYVTDNSKIFKHYRWRPKKNLDRILNDIFFWLKQNKKVRNFFNGYCFNYWLMRFGWI